MPEDDEERIRVAVDHWGKLSEMTDELAWLIGFTLAHQGAGLGLGLAVEHFKVDVPSDAVRIDEHVLLPGTEEDWFKALVRRDRLTAWRVATLAEIIDDRLVSAIFDDQNRLRWLERVQGAIEKWTDFDEIPDEAAVIVAMSVGKLGSEEAALAAMRYHAPEMGGMLEETRKEDGIEWPMWLGWVAANDPVKGIKVAAEAALRSGIDGHGRFGGGIADRMRSN